MTTPSCHIFVSIIRSHQVYCWYYLVSAGISRYPGSCLNTFFWMGGFIVIGYVVAPGTKWPIFLQVVKEPTLILPCERFLHIVCVKKLKHVYVFTISIEKPPWNSPNKHKKLDPSCSINFHRFSDGFFPSFLASLFFAWPREAPVVGTMKKTHRFRPGTLALRPSGAFPGGESQ